MIGRKKPFLIVGLGNPGREYRNNRHNIGFMVLDQLAGKMDTSFSKMKMNALMTAVRYKGQRIILIKPQTFMNLSGKAAASFIRFYKLPLENLLVVYDDVDLPFQTLRMRPNGGDAGQKGVRSIIKELGTKDFPRLRIGINRPPGTLDKDARRNRWSLGSGRLSLMKHTHHQKRNEYQGKPGQSFHALSVARGGLMVNEFLAGKLLERPPRSF